MPHTFTESISHETVLVYNFWKLIIADHDDDDDDDAALAPALKTARFTPNLFSWIYPSIFLFAETLKV